MIIINMNLQKIKKEGIRITSQRKLILEELKKVCTHPNAHQLHQLVLKQDSSIGLATIYRTLDFLEKNGLILKLQSTENEARYDGNVDKHLHLICKQCGDVIDIFDCKNIDIDSQELKESKFEPELDYLEISGLCKKCI